jgi:hypothetical protein
MVPKKAKTLAEKRKILQKVADGINKKAEKKVAGFITDAEIAEKLRIKWLRTPSEAVNRLLEEAFPGRG